MGRKKNKNRLKEKAGPSVANDQLGENAGEGRFEKASREGKCR